jgi:hypothetical protein
VRYQYFAAPASPTKSSSYNVTNMGSIAFFTSGATLYNPLSNTDGGLVEILSHFFIVTEGLIK